MFDCQDPDFVDLVASLLHTNPFVREKIDTVLRFDYFKFKPFASITNTFMN